MKIAVIGCGGIGGTLAAVLALNRHNPHVIEVDEEIVNRLNERGLHVTGKKGDFHVQVRAFRGLSKELGTFDVIFVTVKNNYLRDVFNKAREYLCKDGFIVTNQNGIQVLSLADEFPDTKIIAGAVAYNVEMREYGEYLVRSQGGITFGALCGTGRDDLFLLKSLLEPRIAVDETDDIRGLLWSKLLIVCGVTGLGGVAGMLVGKMLRLRVARKLFYRIITEGALIAKELRIELEKLPGAINPEKFGNHEAGLPLPVRELMLTAVGGIKYRKLKSNFQRDLEQGKRTEVDFLNGALVEGGARTGVPTPVNRKIVEQVHEIEEGKRTMAKRNLIDIADAVKKENTSS
jgi:2-dehydropantoate 2-reductase